MKLTKRTLAGLVLLSVLLSSCGFDTPTTGSGHWNSSIWNTSTWQ